MGLTAGVIAVQGDVSEHVAAIDRLGDVYDVPVDTVRIRTAGTVPSCDVLAMPGGESTTISRLLHREGIATEIIDYVGAGRPLLATCAGLIVAAREVPDDRVQSLGLVDVTIERNAFGRQKDSFEARLEVIGVDEPFHAVFIRAPRVTDLGDGVEVLARHQGDVVAVRDGPVVGTAFHPELTGATAIHDLAFGDRFADADHERAGAQSGR